MKKLSFPIVLLLLLSFSVSGQFLNIQSKTGTDKFLLPELDSITFNLNSPAIKYSLNIHTLNKIIQIKLSDIDSLTFSAAMVFRVNTKSGPVQFPAVEIDSITFSSYSIPNRSDDALSGSEFMHTIQNMSFTEREPLILNEFLNGNIPDFLRTMVSIRTQASDSLGVQHDIVLEVMPDYLSIGKNNDFCRIPMGPQTAQNIADHYGCILPTRKIVNLIYLSSSVRLEPITYAPVGNNNELVTTFIRHNQDIEAKRLQMNKSLGNLIAGLKKDIVITNLLPSKPTRVAIYGWHKLDGSPIQSLYTGHVNYYVDYSHGVRLVNSVMWIDGKETTIQKILADKVLYKLLSDESGIITQPAYKY